MNGKEHQEQKNYIHALHPAQQQRTLKQMERACSLYYLMMGGIYNSVQTAMIDAREAIKDTPLYRHEVKRNIRLAMNAYDALAGKIKQGLGPKYQLWLDTTDAIDDEMYRHTQKLFFAIDAHLLAHNVSWHRARAWMETARILADMAAATFRQLFGYLHRTVGVDMSRLFRGGDFADILHYWERAALPLLSTAQVPGINLNGDANVNLAVDIINTRIKDYHLLNRAGNYALHRNPDQWKYIDDKEARLRLKHGLDICGDAPGGTDGLDLSALAGKYRPENNQ